MIGRLRGPLLEVGDEDAVVEAGGVGYIVRCGIRTLAAMPKPDTEVILHIDSQTREDGTRLYGFLNKDERQAFQALLGVQGVGPKAALAVLDVLSPGQLAQAVAQDDKASVGRANGVGPKLALRIVVELKGKALTSATFEPIALKPAEPVKASVNGESVAALIGLGISETQARLAVEAAIQTLGADAALPAVIRTALKNLGK
ncbi:holliday junction DNA helicase RuvA [Asticcacaulis biprosthecium C19]|uniref:Holliday junction branch migration complex subunit RuvA n=1 Tax=Asticcacaulis biprosthecium C19 TaxID=715226 RepID=F4QHI6_9CAUL|nr:Holliday junction branch migration protein RuvA [Asticcacaulis biprosthecium]EGF92723.1 holliday junction DNA helicase RuvA [Asticcacaulis biprosthecium C19]